MEISRKIKAIASGIRMFESVLFPQQFIRVGDGVKLKLGKGINK